MNLKKEGFQTGKVVFPGIDMMFTLPKNAYFKNDGIVENVEAHTLSLINNLNSRLQNENLEFATGLCLNVDFCNIKTSNIYIVDSGKWSNLLKYGHESVHAIRHLGLDEQFIDKLKHEGFSLKPFSAYKDEESIANVGSIVASYNFHKWLRPHNPIIKPLYQKILEEATSIDEYYKLSALNASIIL